MRPTPIRHIPEDPELLHLFPPPGRTVGAQRDILLPYVFNRDGRCWVRSCDGGHIKYGHEGVVFRSDVQGWASDLRCLIHVPYNVIKLCDVHHGTRLQPKRLEVADWMYQQHGDDWIRWIESLPFKIRPPRVREWLEGHYGN